VSWLDSIRGAFSFLGTRTRGEDAVSQYVIREHHRGRPLSEIITDAYVVNRCSPEQLRRLLERPEVVHAVGDDVIAAAKADAGV